MKSDSEFNSYSYIDSDGRTMQSVVKATIEDLKTI